MPRAILPARKRRRATSSSLWNGPRRRVKLPDMLSTRLSLIDRLRDPENSAAWSEFNHLYQPLLENYVRKHGLKLGMQPSDVEEAVQDVLIGLAKRLPSFQLDQSRARFRTYLWRTANNAAINWLRSKKRTDNVEQLDDEIAALQQAAQSEPDEDWLVEQRRRVLAFALEQIRERTQEKTWACFERHYLQGRRAADVAAELGVSSNVVFVNTSRVLEKLREKCEEYMEDLSHA
jgi:RNA polymerase sigma-70 factor (ECF subfamily)